MLYSRFCMYVKQNALLNVACLKNKKAEIVMMNSQHQVLFLNRNLLMSFCKAVLYLHTFRFFCAGYITSGYKLLLWLLLGNWLYPSSISSYTVIWTHCTSTAWNSLDATFVKVYNVDEKTSFLVPDNMLLHIAWSQEAGFHHVSNVKCMHFILFF